jgi:hypothetical protein
MENYDYEELIAELEESDCEQEIAFYKAFIKEIGKRQRPACLEFLFLHGLTSQSAINFTRNSVDSTNFNPIHPSPIATSTQRESINPNLWREKTLLLVKRDCIRVRGWHLSVGWVRVRMRRPHFSRGLQKGYQIIKRPGLRRSIIRQSLVNINLTLWGLGELARKRLLVDYCEGEREGLEKEIRRRETKSERWCEDGNICQRFCHESLGV